MQQEELETVDCAVCSSEEATLRCAKDGFRIVRCTSCGLYYVNPRPKPKKLSEMYNNDEISPHSYYLATRAEDERTFFKRLQLLEQALGRKGTMLDIGCNIGTLLSLAEKRGWTCYGLDINKQVKKHFQGSTINLTIGDILRASYPQQHFDAIVMNDLIEHVPDPGAMLRKVRGWLKDDGVLFLVTPDGGSFMFSLLGKRWFHLKPNEHLYYFTRRSLTRLFSDTGYSLSSLRHLGRYRSFKTLAQKSTSVFGFLSPFLEKIFRWLHLSSVYVPFNLRDEYGIIARKQLRGRF